MLSSFSVEKSCYVLRITSASLSRETLMAEETGGYHTPSCTWYMMPRFWQVVRGAFRD